MNRFPVVFALFLQCFLIGCQSEEFPSCGSCWCIPGNDGLGPCPVWEPITNFSSEVVGVYSSQVPKNIYTLSCNPYEDSSCVTEPQQVFLNVSSAVCAFKYALLEDGSTSCTEYTIQTYESRSKAIADGAVVTHAGSCGLCSTAVDLALYLTQDFTTAGKICATKGLFNVDVGLQCYMDLGLTRECAKIWNFDGIYDGQACGAICAKELKDPNNGPPPACALNDCLQCDETEAGPIFTAFAGRTRRRSGLRSEIIRDCDSVARINHNPCINSKCGC